MIPRCTEATLDRDQTSAKTSAVNLRALQQVDPRQTKLLGPRTMTPPQKHKYMRRQPIRLRIARTGTKQLLKTLDLLNSVGHKLGHSSSCRTRIHVKTYIQRHAGRRMALKYMEGKNRHRPTLFEGYLSDIFSAFRRLARLSERLEEKPLFAN